jgi:HSP20 family protein
MIHKYFYAFSSSNFNYPATFSPKIDVSEEEDKINIIAEIPGVKKQDVKITLEDDILTIEGEKKQGSEKSLSFKRSFTLPAEVDGEKVEAKIEDGILNISFKKLEPRRKIIELV